MEELAIKDRILLPLHRDGYPFVLGGGVITVVLGLIQPLFWFPGLALVALLLFAFRMPHSVAPTCARAVLSPASGTVLSVEQVSTADLGGALPFKTQEVILVRIGVTLLDAGVLRFPVSGQLVKRTDQAGQPAGMNFSKARTHAGRVDLSIEDEQRAPCFVRLVSSALGRHISLDLQGSEAIPRATACGFLRFGGLVEVMLDPETFEPYATVGMRCHAGETILALAAAAHEAKKDPPPTKPSRSKPGNAERAKSSRAKSPRAQSA